MHVVMVSDNETRGGAGAAAGRLADGLAAAGVRVTRLVGRTDPGPHSWATVRLTSEQGLPRRLLRKVLPAVGDWRDGRDALRELDTRLTELRPDVINLHNIHSIGHVLYSHFPVSAVDRCTRHAPVVWTMHDQWSYTGRCGYAFDCRKFLTGCDRRCPTPHEQPQLAPGKIAGAWAAKKRILDSHPRLVAVAPSRWMAAEATAGLWAGHRVEVIPNGLPLDVYRPFDPRAARAALRLPDGAPVLVAVAEDLTERRKGGRLLVDALAHTRRRPLTVLTLGKQPLPSVPDGVTAVHLGYLSSERLTALTYSAGDLFVHPALADNLPNVFLEAFACGLPAVGFPVTGMTDLIRPGITGWFAADVSAPALAVAIDTALAVLTGGADYRARCRAVAEAEYPVSLQADRYRRLFAELAAAR